MEKSEEELYKKEMTRLFDKGVMGIDVASKVGVSLEVLQFLNKDLEEDEKAFAERLDKAMGTDN